MLQNRTTFYLYDQFIGIFNKLVCNQTLAQDTGIVMNGLSDRHLKLIVDEWINPTAHLLAINDVISNNVNDR
jgi:hypothetical protein